MISAWSPLVFWARVSGSWTSGAISAIGLAVSTGSRVSGLCSIIFGSGFDSTSVIWTLGSGTDGCLV